MTKYAKSWDEIKYLIKAVNDAEANEYRKDFMKIRFESHDNLPLNKRLNLHNLTIIVRSPFPEDFLDKCLYGEFDRIVISE